MTRYYPVYDQNAELAKNVRRLRNERGWSVKELAQICGYSEYMIDDIENGVAAVDVKGLAVLAGAFHVPAPDLIIWKK